MTVFCSGTNEKGKHQPRKMKYYHTSDEGVQFCCPEPNCGKMIVVKDKLPPIWKRRANNKP
jgi:hypothetical protein